MQISIKPLTGHHGLWELRVKFSADISRIFYFMDVKGAFILLHGFVKKSEKTPKREIETALKYRDDHKRRYPDG
jgi:phage-related protein